MSDHPLIEWIVEALRNLGGRAHLSAIYKEVRRLGYDERQRPRRHRGGEDLNKLIRKRIYEHSSDSPQFIKDLDDLFRRRGEERSGIWELREDRASALEESTVTTVSKVSEIDRRISAASNGELSPGQVVILRVLREARKGIGRKTLARGCGLALPVSPTGGRYSSDWLKILKDLQHRGLISIQAPPDDGPRELLHAITAAGKMLLEKAVKASGERGTASIHVEEHDLTDHEIDNALRSNRLRIGIVQTDSQLAQVRRRRGQDRIRELTIENYGGCCAVCDITDRAMLIASHVVGWAEDPEHRGDLSNVICLCRIHDALFEVGYWSLDDKLDLLKKQSVKSKIIRQLLDTMISFKSPAEHPPAAPFVKHHREKAGLGLSP